MGYTGSDPTIIQFEIKKSYQLLLAEQTNFLFLVIKWHEILDYVCSYLLEMQKSMNIWVLSHF